MSFTSQNAGLGDLEEYALRHAFVFYDEVSQAFSVAELV
jgi:hypothetical protein